MSFLRAQQNLGTIREDGIDPTGARVFPVSHFSSREAWERACALCAAKLPQAAAGK